MREHSEKRTPKQTYLFHKITFGIYSLLFILLVFGFTISISAFSAAYGETCEGLSAGVVHTCVLTSGGNVDCYGGTNEDDFGQDEDYTSGNAIAVSAGGWHTCVLTSSGDVDCYGFNDYGQAEDYTNGDAIGVSAGRTHTCVLTSNGNVDCYGENSDGQAEDYTSGDAISVSAGRYHTCILTASGNVDCYGGNLYGQVVDYTSGDAIGVSAARYHTCILTSNGNVDCSGLTPEGEAEDYTNGDAIAVSAGLGHTCVLTSSGNAICYGLNSDGQAADYTNGNAIGVSTGGWHTCVLTSSGNVDCYGDNSSGQATDYNNGDGVCSSSICEGSVTDIIPVPADRHSLNYPPIPSPVMSSVFSQARPVGLGSLATGGTMLSIQVGLNDFSGPVDIYGAFRMSTDLDHLNVLNPDGTTFGSFTLAEIESALATGTPPAGAQPWQSNVVCSINEHLFDIPVSSIPQGVYTIFLLVTPAGSLDNYYLWTTSFAAN